MSKSSGRLLPALVPGVIFAALAVVFVLCLGTDSAVTVAVVAGVLVIFAAAAFFMLRSLHAADTAARTAAFFIPLLVLLLARVWVFNYQTLDYQDFLAPWTDFFRAHGGLSAIGAPIGNYNVPYLFFLAVCSYIPVPELYLIKLFSVFFELVLAYALGRITLHITKSSVRAGLCFVLTLALPTVFLNGSLWGQCDSVYASLALLSVALGLEKKPVFALISAGVAFAFKLQAIFVLPIFALFLFTGRVKWYHLPVFPAAYLVAVSPAIIAGRGFWDTVLTYFSDAATIGASLNYNSPSVFAFITEVSDPVLAGHIGTLVSFMLCAALIIAVAACRRRVKSPELLLCAAILAVGVPLFLPHMHDRYFFMADAIVLAAAFCKPKLSVTVPLVSFASLLGYHAYLRMRYLLPMKWGFFALLLVLLLLVCAFASGIRLRKK